MDDQTYSGDDRRRIFVAANGPAPSKQALAELESFLDSDPDGWRYLGDLCRNATRQAVQSLRAQPMIKASIEAGVIGLKRDLSYADAGQLERLLIDQIVLGWLVHYEAQGGYSSAMASGPSIELAAWWEKRLTMTQKRYLRAIEALARVRKLSARTPLQINIGGQQINMAGPGEAVNVTAPPAAAGAGRRRRSKHIEASGG